MTETAAQLPDVFAAEVERDVVEVTGPDAITFLQGQLSQDVDALAVGTSTWTFVLQPQGKVDAWARITKVAADRLLVDLDVGHGEPLVERLARFKIRTKAELALATWSMVAVRGAEAPRAEVPAGVHRLPLAGPVPGYDLLVEDADAGAETAAPAGVPVVGSEVLDAHRIVHGIPAMGAELDERTIPAEVGQWIVDESVSFTKGCFVGQELVARIDSRGGNVPRHLRAVVLDDKVVAGASVEAPGPEATVSSVTQIGDVHVALAYLGRAVEPGATVSVAGVAGVVHELPLTGPLGT